MGHQFRKHFSRKIIRVSFSTKARNHKPLRGLPNTGVRAPSPLSGFCSQLDQQPPPTSRGSLTSTHSFHYIVLLFPLDVILFVKHFTYLLSYKDSNLRKNASFQTPGHDFNLK